MVIFIFLVLSFVGCDRMSKFTTEEQIKILNAKEKVLVASKRLIGAEKGLVKTKIDISDGKEIKGEKSNIVNDVVNSIRGLSHRQGHKKSNSK
jgi:hypothetical protein